MERTQIPERPRHRSESDSDDSDGDPAVPIGTEAFAHPRGRSQAAAVSWRFYSDTQEDLP